MIKMKLSIISRPKKPLGSSVAENGHCYCFVYALKCNNLYIYFSLNKDRLFQLIIRLLLTTGIFDIKIQKPSMNNDINKSIKLEKVEKHMWCSCYNHGKWILRPEFQLLDKAVCISLCTIIPMEIHLFSSQVIGSKVDLAL